MALAATLWPEVPSLNQWTLQHTSPAYAVDVSSQLQDLGSYEPASDIDGNALTVIQQFNRKLYLGSSALSSRPMVFDPATLQWSVSLNANGSSGVVPLELIHGSQVVDGEVLFRGEDQDGGGNRSGIVRRSENGWRYYETPLSDAHRVDQYKWKGRFFSGVQGLYTNALGQTFGFNYPALAISNGDDVSYTTYADGVTYPGVGPNLYRFFEFGGHLWVIGTNSGTQKYFLSRYTGSSTAPLQLVYARPEQLAPGSNIIPGFEVPGLPVFVSVKALGSYLFLTNSDGRVWRCSSVAATASDGTSYLKPTNGVLIGAFNSVSAASAMTVRRGVLYWARVTGETQMEIKTTSDGLNWNETATLTLTSGSGIQASTTLNLTVHGEHLYLCAGKNLYRIPGSAIPGFNSGSPNVAPVAQNDAYTVTSYPFRPRSAGVGVLANDSDANAYDGQDEPFWAELVSQPANGSVSFNDNGTFTYLPNAGFQGTDTFSYRVSDGDLTSSPATVTLSVNGQGPTSVKGASLWLRADAGVTSDASGFVSQWDDQSGNQAHATQTTLANQAKVVAGAIGTRPAIRFDGNNDVLVLPAGFADWRSGLTTFVVHKPTGAAGGARVWELATNTGGDNRLALTRNGTTNDLAYRTSKTATTPNFANALPLNEVHLLSLSQGAGALGATTPVESWKDGVSLGSDTSVIPSLTTRSVGRIGRGVGGSNPFKGDIAEILIYPRSLSTGERQAVEAYLLSKYGLSAPVAPANLSASAGTNQIALSWNSVEWATGYNIYRGTSSGSYDPTPLNAAPLTTTSFTDTAVTAGTTYFYIVKAVNSAGESSASNQASATPQLPGPGGVSGATLWLKADAGVTKNASNLVSLWDDQTSNNADGTQTTGTAQPLWVSAQLNGLPTLRFDGTSDFLSLPGGFADWTQGVSVFVVAKPTTAGNHATFFEFTTASGTAHRLRLLRNGTTTNLAYRTGSATTPNFTGALPVGEAHMWSVVQNGGSAGTSSAVEAWKNGVSVGTASSLVPVNVSRTLNRIARNSTTEYFAGDLAELVLFPRALSASERQNVESYLQDKWFGSGGMSAQTSSTTSGGGS